MKSLTDYITEAISDDFKKTYFDNKPLKVDSNCTWASYQNEIKHDMKHYKEVKEKFIKLEKPTDDEFIKAFSEAWYPGEGDTKNSYASKYVAHYMATNLGLKCVTAWNAGRAGSTEKHFTIYYMPLDSKGRNCSTYVTAEENTAYQTHGGYHGSESDIHWIDEKAVKSRKDFAEIVLKLMKSVKA